jgi:threonine/homoserine/homoserine lactone efflux protein
MNKNVLITLGVVAGVGAIAFLGYKLYKAKQTPTQASSTGANGAHQVAPGTTATGSNANSTNWLTTIGGLFGQLGTSLGNSNTPTSNSTTSSPVTTDNTGETTSLDDLYSAYGY